MIRFQERDLQIDFPSGTKVRKFDDQKSHGLSCMKAVDFIVEEEDRVLFIEFKDPNHPEAREEHKDKFIERFRSGELNENLKYKYRDTFLYEWASGNIDNKEIHYYVLVAIEDLTPEFLGARTDDLRRDLPLAGPLSGIWKRRIVEGCTVLNIEAWNRRFPCYPVTRISSGP